MVRSMYEGFSSYLYNSMSFGVSFLTLIHLLHLGLLGISYYAATGEGCRRAIHYAFDLLYNIAIKIQTVNI